MASLAAGVIDPTKVGKYRVVLSDALLGKEPKEIYTGVRYNHKPSLSSPSAPHQARIKPTGSADSYDLSFQDDGGRYAYQGTRGHEGNQYVLLFDPDKEVFVLHHVDSIFNMNLVRTPTNTDADSLRRQHPQLEAHSSSRTNKTVNKASSNKPTKPAKTKKPAVLKEPKSAKKLEPSKPTRPIKSNNMDHDSNDESSDDDLLTIEDPGGAAPAPNRDFSPGFIDKPRRFSEFVQQQNEEEEEAEADDEYPEIEIDADGEEEDDDDDDEGPDNFDLPSPIHRQMMSQNINGSGAQNNFGSTSNTTQAAPVEEESDEDEDEEAAAQDDIGVDLEAELMAELEREESDVSEEE